MVRVSVEIDESVSSIWRTVVVFEAADDWDVASARARELGVAKTRDYRNGDGNLVRHRFVGVESLDMLGATIDDGREVWFESVPSDTHRSLGPIADRPPQTGV
jgi:hypothetical protein